MQPGPRSADEQGRKLEERVKADRAKADAETAFVSRWGKRVERLNALGQDIQALQGQIAAKQARVTAHSRSLSQVEESVRDTIVTVIDELRLELESLDGRLQRLVNEHSGLLESIRNAQASLKTRKDEIEARYVKTCMDIEADCAQAVITTGAISDDDLTDGTWHGTTGPQPAYSPAGNTGSIYVSSDDDEPPYSTSAGPAYTTGSFGRRPPGDPLNWMPDSPTYGGATPGYGRLPRQPRVPRRGPSYGSNLGTMISRVPPRWRVVTVACVGILILVLVVKAMAGGHGNSGSNSAGWPTAVAAVNTDVQAACSTPNVAAAHGVNFACGTNSSQLLMAFSVGTSDANPSFVDPIKGAPSRVGLMPLQQGQMTTIWNTLMKQSGTPSPTNPVQSLAAGARAINQIVASLEANASNCQRYTGSSKLGSDGLCAGTIATQAEADALVGDLWKTWWSGTTSQDATDVITLFNGASDPASPAMQAVFTQHGL